MPLQWSKCFGRGAPWVAWSPQVTYRLWPAPALVPGGSMVQVTVQYGGGRERDLGVFPSETAGKAHVLAHYAQDAGHPYRRRVTPTTEGATA